MDDIRIKINLESSSDVNDEARQSESLKIERPVHAIKCFSMATADEGLPSRYTTEDEPKTRPMPHMSDGELYLRLNVPDGLQNDGSYAEHYGLVQHAHANPDESPIKTDDGR